jgi:hypothetical protein
VKFTGSRATVSVSLNHQESFYPRDPLSYFMMRRAVKMVQARRLAFTLNGHSLTSGVLSRIDFTIVLFPVSIFKIHLGICSVNFVQHSFDCRITKRTDVPGESLSVSVSGEKYNDRNNFKINLYLLLAGRVGHSKGFLLTL